MPELFTRTTKRFYAYGIDLNNPVDSIPEGYWPYLLNVRSYQGGILQPRFGLTAVGQPIAATFPLHSIRRLNDASQSAGHQYAYILGTGSKLAAYQTGPSFTQLTYNSVNIDFGDANPLSLVPFRPDQSPTSWMYIGGSNGLFKTSINGAGYTTHKVGLAPPKKPPIVELSAPFNPSNVPDMNYGGGGPMATDLFLPGPTGNWTITVDTSRTTIPYDGASLAVTASNRFSGNVTAFLMDDNIAGDTVTATAGWGCCIINDSGITGPTLLGPKCHMYMSDTGGNQWGSMVYEYYPASNLSTLIKTVIYDTAPSNTGYCSVVLNTPLTQAVRNAVLSVAGTYFRILAVDGGADGNRVLRINTFGLTITAGSPVAIIESFRFNSGLKTCGSAIGSDIRSGNIVGTSTVLTCYAFQNTLNLNAGTGHIAIRAKTPITIDLTQRRTLTGTVPGGGSVPPAITDDDYFHVGIKTALINQLNQYRVLFDCDDGTFTKNYYYYAITPDDLTAAALGTQTISDAAANQNAKDQIFGNTRGGHPYNKDMGGYIDSGPVNDPNASPENRGFLNGTHAGPPSNVAPIEDPYGGISFGGTGIGSGRSAVDPNIALKLIRGQASTGDNQWSDLVFARGACIRVGNDQSKNWATVKAVAIEFVSTEITSVGALPVTFTVEVFSVLGGGAPDAAGLASGYSYRYRYRCSSTGVASNWSPASESPIRTWRTPIRVSFGTTVVDSTGYTNVVSGIQPEVDMVDIQRWGGYLTNWINVGSAKLIDGLIYDNLDDLTVAANAPFSEGNVHFQPWPVTSVPMSGTASSVAGDMLVSSGGPSFQPNLAPGTGIRIGGFNTTIKKVMSATVLQTYDYMPNMSSTVRWEIPEPTLLGVPLPRFWGPWRGRFFACGSSNLPGTLFVSNSNDPDSTREELRVEITAPTDPLVNGCIYNDHCYVFSNEKMFEIAQIGDSDQFVYNEVPNGKGLFTPWGLALGERIWFIAKDGIYQTSGGMPISITDRTLFPLFPNEGNLGTSVNGVIAPAITVANKSVLRLSYYDNYLYLDYKGIDSNYYTLVYNPHSENPGWMFDTYTPAVMTHTGGEGDGVHEIMCGGFDGYLYTLNGTSDNGTAISWAVQSPYFDAGDRRADKHWGDFIIDAYTASNPLSITVYRNSSTAMTATTTPTTMTNAARGQTIFNIGNGLGNEAKNISLKVTGSNITGIPQLFFWEPSYVLRPEDTELRYTELDDCGVIADKYFQGIELEFDTFGLDKPLAIMYDGTTTGHTFTINNNGRLQKAISFTNPFIAHEVRIAPIDSTDWKLYKWRWIYQPEPPLVLNYGIGQQTSYGLSGFVHHRDAYIELKSTAPVVWTVTRVEDGQTWSYTIPSTGGKRLKNYIVLQPMKGKGFQHTLTSASGFRLYLTGCEIRVKPWASEEQFGVHQLFGDQHGNGAAPI